jgi:hypothetical protein
VTIGSDRQGPLDLAIRVAAELDALGIAYVVGGSLAAAFVGEPRSTNDIDLAVDLRADQLDRLASALRSEFYVPESLARAAIELSSSFNVIPNDSAYKVDLFVLGDGVLDRNQLARRRHIRVADDPPTMLWITSPEDVVLRKLDWFRLGGEASDRQWRDIAGVLKVQRDALDQTYLTATAAEVGLTSLLARAVAAAREED